MCQSSGRARRRGPRQSSFLLLINLSTSWSFVLGAVAAGLVKAARGPFLHFLHRRLSSAFIHSSFVCDAVGSVREARLASIARDGPAAAAAAAAAAGCQRVGLTRTCSFRLVLKQMMDECTLQRRNRFPLRLRDRMVPGPATLPPSFPSFPSFPPSKGLVVGFVYTDT